MALNIYMLMTPKYVSNIVSHGLQSSGLLIISVSIYNNHLKLKMTTVDLLIVLLQASGNSFPPIAQPPNHGVILDFFSSQPTCSPSANPISLLQNVNQPFLRAATDTIIISHLDNCNISFISLCFCPSSTHLQQPK